MRRIAVATILVLAAAALAGIARPEGARAVEAPVADSITVVGSGSATYVPDRSSLSLTVLSKNSSAAATLAANAKAMRAVIAAVRALGGVALSTESISLSQESSSTDFGASNSVEAEVAISRAGAVIDAAVAAGANRVSGSAFTTSDRAALYRQALNRAVNDAREKAQLLATAGGRALGKVETIVEGGSTPSSVTASISSGSTPVIVGEQTLQAYVTVRFALA